MHPNPTTKSLSHLAAGSPPLSSYGDHRLTSCCFLKSKVLVFNFSQKFFKVS